jgi:short-subunit dehydrogenase
MNLHHKVIVITGASSGFGELIARRCAAAGADLVLAARSADKLQQLATELRPARALPVPTDIADEQQVQHLVQATMATFGHVDVLINNAGFGVFDLVDDGAITDLEAMLAVNVVGAVRCTQAFLPHMQARRRGQIIMMASQASFVVTPKMGFYAASKHALIGISRALMMELHGSGIVCTAICPGEAPTGFQRYADVNKYARVTLWSKTTAEEVANVTMQAIQKPINGEVVVPGWAMPLMRIANTFPAITRFIIRLLG